MHLQSSKHVARRDAVNSNVGMSPFDGERCGKVSNTSLGSVVRSLGLRDVDNGTGHATDHDNASWGLSLHQVAGN